jgi:hypothetical protein
MNVGKGIDCVNGICNNERMAKQTWYNEQHDQTATVITDDMSERDRMCMLYTDGFSGMVHLDTVETVLGNGWEQII